MKKKTAPSFVANDEQGKEHSLEKYQGQWILLYFYPRDNTPGCTKEACAFRDIWKELKKENVVVLGVSAQDEVSHKKFIEKYSLPFPLLVDNEKELSRSYGAWGKKRFLGREYEGMKRVSFLINPEGMIAKEYEKVQPATHAQEVLEDVRSFKKA